MENPLINVAALTLNRTLLSYTENNSYWTNSMNIEHVKNQTKIVSSHQMRSLLEGAIKILEKERIEGKMGSQKVVGGLIDILPEGKAVVVGDVHGDFDSLTYILRESEFLKRVEQKKVYLIFLGDYGDRGEETIEVYFALLRLKISFPENVVLLRGNHEPAPGLGVYPFDLPYFLRAKYPDEEKDFVSIFSDLFNLLPHTAKVREKYLMLHAGLPENIKSIDDIAFAHKTHPDTSYFEEILWSDPKNIKGTYPSPRGAGKIFGEDISKKVLHLLGIKTLIRSHEPCEGVAPIHGGKILTLFSRKGSPYYNNKAAYLDIDLSAPAKDACELAREAHLF
ncbi:serine/threonine protein phosphatase [Candidatus Aerophobetes bacterium]|nr:serine/threonine protein phosphatase [Candidatus Aerophobetes bacterium]